MARYRLKFCLKGPLNPIQPTNQPSYLELSLVSNIYYTEAEVGSEAQLRKVFNDLKNSVIISWPVPMHSGSCISIVAVVLFAKC